MGGDAPSRDVLPWVAIGVDCSQTIIRLVWRKPRKPAEAGCDESCGDLRKCLMRVATRRCMIAARPGERAKDERGDGVGQVRASGDGDGRVDRARSTASQQAAPGAPELRGLLLPLPDALCARPRRAVLHVPTEQR